jgi:HEAT repeat protein
LRSLLVAVACVAALLWSARSLFDQARPMIEHARTLDRGDREARRDAAGALAEAEGDDIPLAVQALGRALHDGEPSVRATAAGALAVQCSRALAASPSGPPRWVGEAARDLIAALDDPSAEVRSSAALGLQTLYARPRPATANGAPPPAPPQIGRAVEALTAALGDDEESVRLASISTLGVIAQQTPLAPPRALIAALESGTPPVRSLAGHALGAFERDVDEAARALLRVVRAEPPDSPLGGRCAQSLRQLRPSAGLVPDLVEALRSGDDPARFVALTQLAHYGPEAAPAVPALLEALDRPVPAGDEAALAISCDAATALGAIGPGAGEEGRVIEALRRALGSEHERRRWHAAEALGHFRPPRDAVLSDLIARIDREEPGATPIWGAAEALGRLAPGTPRADEALAAIGRALDRSEPYGRTQVIEALTRFGAKAAPLLPRLRALAQPEQGDPQLREAARRALLTLEGDPR